MAKKEPPYGYPLDATLNRGRAQHHHHQGIVNKADPHPADDEDFDSRMLYPDLSLITTTQNATQNAQYGTAAAANAGTGQPGTVVSVAGSINPTPIVAPSYPGAYHTALTAGGHQLKQEYGHAIVSSGGPGGARSDYYCHDCNINFDHANAFLEHVSHGHPEQNGASNIMEIGKMILRCPICPATFHRRPALNEHMQTIHHQQPPPLPSPSPHQGHNPAGPGHHGSGPGSQGPPSTSSTPAPRANSTTPFVPPGDGLFCPECKNPFANKYSLMKHLRSTRCRQESEATINRIINDQLTCNRCYKQFGSIQALNKHVEAKKCSPVEMPRGNIGGEQAPRPLNKGLVFDEAIQLTPYATVTVYRCPDRMCGKPCVTLRAFKMHAKCVHKGIDLTPLIQEAKANFICKVRGCGKLFVEEQQLDVHFKHHENYTPRVGKHRCHLCNEAFYQRDMLKKHVLSFHDEVSSYSRGGGKRGKNRGAMANAYAYRRNPFLNTAPLKYNHELRLTPGTLMTVYKCPIEDCKKGSCTDMKSFKLHALHIHQDKNILPIVDDVEAKYICQVDGCGKLYLERKQFEIHQRHHKTYVPSKGRYYRCSQCESKFNSQSNLDVHVIQVHMSGREGKNELIFDDVQLEPNTMMTVYHCPVAECTKRNYLDAKSVRTHCRRFHSMLDYEPIPSQAEAQFICQVRGCRKLFMEPIQIEAHLKHHRNYIPTNGVFECNCCPETFTRKEQLDQHTLQCHTPEGIMRHNSMHHTHTLGVGTIVHHGHNNQAANAASPQDMSSNDGYSPHQNSIHHSVHGSHMRPDYRNNMPKVIGYQCTICMRKFLHLGTHCNHVNNAHGQPGLQPMEVEMKPRYTCKMARCGRHFMTKNMYRTHMERHQTGKGKRSASCFKCGRTFSQFKSLYQHLVQTHSDVSAEEIAELEQQHAKCPICLSVFRNQEILRNHMRRHQDDKGQIVHNANVLAPTTPILQQPPPQQVQQVQQGGPQVQQPPPAHPQQAHQTQQQQERGGFGKGNFWSPVQQQHMLLR